MDGVGRATSLRRFYLDTDHYTVKQDGAGAVGRALSALPALESLRYRGFALLSAVTTALPYLASTLLELDVDFTKWTKHDDERAAFLRALPAVSRLEVRCSCMFDLSHGHRVVLKHDTAVYRLLSVPSEGPPLMLFLSRTYGGFSVWDVF